MTQYVETYMSPALHTTKDGSQYVLYGQGGETVKGILSTSYVFLFVIYSSHLSSTCCSSERLEFFNVVVYTFVAY